MKLELQQELFIHFSQFISEERNKKFEELIQHRTKHFTVVLEDIFQPHNASAVLRSCDCFGIQDVHIIENQYQYKLSPDVALGSSKWLSLSKYNSLENNTIACFNSLREKGYQIIATTPHTNSATIENFDITKRSALVFGTELNGLSEIAMNNADGYLKIPMYGFTESFNISVSAAIILNRLRTRLNESEIKWQLSEEEKVSVLLQWAKSTVKKSQLIEDAYILQHHKK